MARLELYINDQKIDEEKIVDVEEMYTQIAHWKVVHFLEDKTWEAYLIRPVRIEFTTQKKIFVEKKVYI